jgi:ribosomal protein L40E
MKSDRRNELPILNVSVWCDILKGEIVVIGFLLVLVGFWFASANYPTFQNLQSSIGQVGRVVDPELEQEYENAMTATFGGALLLVVGFVAVIIGAATGPSQASAELVSPTRSASEAATLTPLERRIMTLCPECKAPISRAATMCPSCGNCLNNAKVSEQPTVQQMIDEGKISLEAARIPEHVPQPRLETEHAHAARRIERVFCYYCGQAMPSDAVFCRICGKKQEHPSSDADLVTRP